LSLCDGGWWSRVTFGKSEDSSFSSFNPWPQLTQSTSLPSATG
jgi:hypothetical protein